MSGLLIEMLQAGEISCLWHNYFDRKKVIGTALMYQVGAAKSKHDSEQLQHFSFLRLEALIIRFFSSLNAISPKE